MASVTTFDNLSIDGVAVPAADFVAGSGSFKETGKDIETTTADGKMHHDRQSIKPEAACSLYGNKESLNSPAGLGQAIVIKRGAVTVKSFTGIISAEYDSASRQTKLTLTGDPIVQ